MDLDEQVKQIILDKISLLANERSLDEEEIIKRIKPIVQFAYADGPKMMADGMVKHLTQQIPEMIEQERTLQAGFEQRLYTRWKPALDLFEATIILTREAGDRFFKKQREQAVAEKDMLFAALLRLHLRACQTASAIGALMKSGFARDALARQRTLHELAVVALLLKEHGPSLAERFLMHEIIETCAAAERYEQYYVRLGYEPPDPDNLAYLRAEKARLCQRFGEDFKSHYGWAVGVIGPKKPKFEDLEKAAALDHFSPYYRMASYGVHATAKGIAFDIGNLQSLVGGPRELHSGASNAGLADPGHGSLLSLHQCTIAFLTGKPDIEGLAMLQTLGSFVDEAGQAFLRIHQEQVQEEKQDVSPLVETCIKNGTPLQPIQ